MALIIVLPVLLFSIILHEYAHGWAAERFGDDTARVMGRLTFNPIPHIDIFGTILLPLLLSFSHLPPFGWAKPVPVNPYRLNNPTRDMIWVSLAGPLSNLGLAIIAAFLMWILGSTTASYAESIRILLNTILYYNILLPILNLVPVPPLDGSKVLTGILPSNLAYQYAKIEHYGIFVVLFLFYSGIMWRFIGPIITFIFNILGGSIYFLAY